MEATSDIAIRSARRADAATIHALTQALAADMDSLQQVTSKPEDFANYGFGDTRRFWALLAERDGHAVGLCVYFRTFSSWRGQPGIYVQDLYVSPDVRGANIGQRLLAEAARRGAADGATHVRLCVDHRNTAAQGFYAATGLHWRDDERVFEAVEADFLALADSCR